MSSPEYELIYHAGVPGRGEFVRLVFEATGTPYKDSALVEGQKGVQPYMDGSFEGNGESSLSLKVRGNPLPFAPPILRHGTTVISQTPNILLYLATHLTSPIDLESGADAGEPASKRAKHSPATFDDPSTFHAHAFALTALDAVNEAHDTHHPIDVAKYYDEQKEAALLKAKSFREERLPKFCEHFETNLQKSSSDYLLSAGPTYADLVLFQLVDGLNFAFPKRMGTLLPRYPKIAAHYEKTKAAPRIKAYLESGRRQKYSMGVFRHYEELDGEE
ncbi:hypothetical protein JCM21900_002727 [Sporobolomyces salmonicolor]